MDTIKIINGEVNLMELTSEEDKNNFKILNNRAYTHLMASMRNNVALNIVKRAKSDARDAWVGLFVKYEA